MPLKGLASPMRSALVPSPTERTASKRAALPGLRSETCSCSSARGLQSSGEATRAWIIAQLQLHGVAFSKADKKPALMDTLEKAVKSGQCNKPGPAAEAVEDALRRQYDAKMEVHNRAVERWKEDEFKRLEGNPSHQACFDVDRFLAKYFLDGLHGRPDQGKTRDPLALNAHYFSVKGDLYTAVDSVPGLALHKTRDLAVIGWDTELDRGLEREFSKLGSSSDDQLSLPTREANLDFDRFLKKHFHVGINGVANTSGERPPTPVTLFSFFENGRLLKDFVSRTPAFCVKSAWGKFGDTTKVLGWDAGKVDAEVRRIEEKRRRYEEERAAEERARRQEMWERILKPHREYVARQQPCVGSLGLQHLPGSYIVRSDELSQSFGFERPWTLDIFPAESTHGLKASFCFDFIQGTMLLAMSERSVDLLREEQPKEGHSDSEGWDDDDGCADAGESTGEKRQVGSISDPWGVQAAMAKRQKTAVQGQGSRPNRVYFQFAYNAVDTDPEMDLDNEQVGLLDFDSQLSAHGVMQLHRLMSEPVTLSIYKIADSPAAGREPQPWSDFNSRRRWGGW